MNEITFKENNEKFTHCSFCQIPRTSVVTVMIGNNACICPNCILASHKLLLEKTNTSTNFNTELDVPIKKLIINTLIITVIGIISIIGLFFYY